MDDCLAVSHDARSLLDEIDNFFEMKAGSIGDPDMYLGGKLKEMVLPNGVTAWAMSSSKYVQEATANVEKFINAEMDGHKLNKRAATPMPTGYDPVMDTSPELTGKLANFYQSQLGVLRWIVELGRVDIMTETSLLASQVACPREGHLVPYSICMRISRSSITPGWRLTRHTLNLT